MNSALPPDIRRLSQEELCRILTERSAPLRKAARAEFRRRESALVRLAYWASALLLFSAAVPVASAAWDDRPPARQLLARA
jgi:hypothetical protein